MNRRYQFITLSLTFAAAVLFSSPTFAQCDSCGGGGGFVQSGGYGGAGFSGGGFSNGGCDSGGCNFGYPGGGAGGAAASGHCGRCSGCLGGGKCLQGIKNHYHHLSEIHKRDFARNQAWPKPFQCADRQLYFSMWEPMLDRGFRNNCLLTNQHFDTNTNELNQAGIAKIAGIFQNSPRGQKVALVQNLGNKAVVDARLNSLRSTIDQWYGSNAFTEIAAADNFPTQFSGQRVSTLQTLANETTPPPFIPVATGTGSTSDVGN